jgi:very-short-patch-repair endonuclease
VELDGYRGHHTPAQLARDHRRDLILRRAGIQPLRYSRRDVVALEPEVLADLTRALYQR